MSFKTQIDALEEKLANDTTGDAFNEKELNVLTRARIGRLFVLGFFIALGLSIIFVLVYNGLILYYTKDTSLFVQIENVIPLVGSVIGAPLGFVMGYYFKSNGE